MQTETKCVTTTTTTTTTTTKCLCVDSDVQRSKGVQDPHVAKWRDLKEILPRDAWKEFERERDFGGKSPQIMELTQRQRQSSRRVDTTKKRFSCGEHRGQHNAIPNAF